MTSRINLEGVVGVAKVDIGWTALQTPGGAGGGGGLGVLPYITYTGMCHPRGS